MTVKTRLLRESLIKTYKEVQKGRKVKPVSCSGCMFRPPIQPGACFRKETPYTLTQVGI